MPVTVSPRSSRRRVSVEPMNPATPVTRTCIERPPCSADRAEPAYYTHPRPAGPERARRYCRWWRLPFDVSEGRARYGVQQTMSTSRNTGGLSRARLTRMHDVMAGHVERGYVPG